IWDNDQIIGQLEFKCFSDEAETGYIHLIYLIPEYRGSGVADTAQQFMADTLYQAGCQAMLLTVSRTNVRALRHYRRWGWQRVGEDGSLRGTDIYRREIWPHKIGVI
ncbi:MAG: GNAT family N-acetyltransferase, partial [Photobacterium halotolerans]